MRIVSLNGWGGKLLDPLLAWLSVEQPDVLCLQEVVRTPGTHADWLTYRDGDHVLPQRPNFFADVAAALPDHVAQFCAASQGVLWDGDEAVPSQFGLATFVHNSLPVTAQVQGFVHGAFSPHGYGEHPRPRNAHVVRLFDYEANRPVVVAHMHGLRHLDGKHDTPERMAQAKRLRDLIGQVVEPGDPLVVCGDFNLEPESATFDVLRQIGLVDLVTARGFSSTRTSHYAKPGKFADYLLVNRHVEVKQFTVLATPEVSDHCPLLLEI